MVSGCIIRENDSVVYVHAELYEEAMKMLSSRIDSHDKDK